MTVQPLYVETLTSRLADVSTADEAYIRVPSDGVIERCDTILHGAITGADNVVTVKQTGSASATLGTITIANSGSAAGDVDSLSLDTAVVAGDIIEFESSGASTGTHPLSCQLQIRKLTR